MYFCFNPIKISQRFLGSRVGSKFWQLPWLPAKNHPHIFGPSVPVLAEGVNCLPPPPLRRCCVICAPCPPCCMSCRRKEKPSDAGRNTTLITRLTQCTMPLKLYEETKCHLTEPENLRQRGIELKPVAFTEGKKSQAIQTFFIFLSIEIKLKKWFQRWDSIQNSI